MAGEPCFSKERHTQCCEPGEAPRDIFRCADRDEAWSQLSRVAHASCTQNISKQL